MTRFGLLLVGLVVAALPPAAQQPAPAFEVASIKRNTSVGGTFRVPRFEGAGFLAINLPIEPSILLAYGVASTELVGGPAWIRERGGDRFDVTARMREGMSRQDQLAMLRHLLESRFALKVHREQRQMPVYVLTKLTDNGELGPKLRRAAKDCLPNETCGGSSSISKTEYRGAQWPFIVRVIARPLDLRLIDRTGLSGTFDFELTHGRALSVNADDSSVDVFTAVRQQLGLKLEASKAPIEVLVIDSVERPTTD